LNFFLGGMAARWAAKDSMHSESLWCLVKNVYVGSLCSLWIFVGL
jgi:hypothetical protein